MTTFLRLLSSTNKQLALLESIENFRSGEAVEQLYEVDPLDFRKIPGAPFAYWSSPEARATFSRCPPLESQGRDVQSGASTMNDFRFLRLWWEVPGEHIAASRKDTFANKSWVVLSKGGAYASYYVDWELLINWAKDGKQLKTHVAEYRGRKGWGYHWAAALNGHSQYFRPAVTWPRRSQKGLSGRVLPGGGIFGDKGPSIFCDQNDQSELLAILALVNSDHFYSLVSLQVAFGSYEVGAMERTPIPDLDDLSMEDLAQASLAIWQRKKNLDSTEETSHAFKMPKLIQETISEFNERQIVEEIDDLSNEVNKKVGQLYGFGSDENAIETLAPGATGVPADSLLVNGSDDTEVGLPASLGRTNVLSWCVGVSFGRFDWHFAIGENEFPPEQGPFDPLPVVSPAMRSVEVSPYHQNSGILVDDAGHIHDLPRLLEAVLELVAIPVADNLRGWLRDNFFKEHLKQYSKSRRKAPIYWPLSTASGSYTVWIYYPDLDDQTLYTAVNDFLAPKLKLISDELNSLRAMSNRNAAEEREQEHQQDLEQELIELRDTILEIAPSYKPNHDDGAQITAAPLWPLFRHKPWQKILKDTWEKLEDGEYDWAHLAYSYWPNRVREKCKTDESLAIAHGLEELYVEPDA